MTTRIRSPFLTPRVTPAAYTFEDTLDASTPADLTAASWGVLHARVNANPAWVGRSKTFLVVAKDVTTPRDLLPFLPRNTPMERVFVRFLRDGRVVRRGWGYMIAGLRDREAMMLPLTLSRTPVLHQPAERVDALLLPAQGPSATVSPLCGVTIAKMLGVEFEVEAHQAEKAIIKDYGFNPIPAFRRLFELQNDPPFAGVF